MTTPAARSAPLEDAADLLLVLLYAPGKSGSFGEPVEGSTRLQKLFFLLREGEGPQALVDEAKTFDFDAYKMGPFSAELRDTVEELVAARIIEAQPLDYVLQDDAGEPDDSDEESSGKSRHRTRNVTSFRYRLSADLGMRIGPDLWAKLDGAQAKAMAEFKSFFNSISLRQLLIFTYEKFPDYTRRSTIRDQLGF